MSKSLALALVEPPASGLQEASEQDNRLRRIDRAAHDWYRFVLSFPPHLVRAYLERFKIGPRDLVLDPFCGTGTTLVECKKHAIPSLGIEPNPMAAFASRLKVDWTADADRLVEHASLVAERASGRLKEQGIGELGDLPLFKPSGGLGAKLKELPAEAHKLLLTNSISPLPLHKSLVLLETLEEANDHRFAGYERLALARSLVADIGNLHFGPEVGIGALKTDAPVIESWLKGVKRIAADLPALRVHAHVPSMVYQEDARQVGVLLPANSVTAVITSPPYPNEKDYTRTTRLESVLLGFLRTKKDVRLLKQRLVRSNTRSVYKSDTDDRLVRDNPTIQALATEIELRRLELGKTSGFERLYPRVTKLYFGGMKRHLMELRQVLKKGAWLAYVVGDQASYLRVMIRTGQLLADIAQSIGYEVVGLDLFRTRLATATREQLREEVLVLRWPGLQTAGHSRPEGGKPYE